MTYRVTWEIEVEASSYDEAALKAREIQLRVDSAATFFTVRPFFRRDGLVTKEIDTGLLKPRTERSR